MVGRTLDVIWRRFVIVLAARAKGRFAIWPEGEEGDFDGWTLELELQITVIGSVITKVLTQALQP